MCLDAWRDGLRALGADDCAKLRAFSHQSEREFLVDLRAFIQDLAAAQIEPAQDAVQPPAPSEAVLGDLLQGLPLAHQEIAFLTLAGYSPSTVETILRVTPAIADAGLERLRGNYAQVLERTGDRCLWPAAWLHICRAARANVQKDCVPLRQLVRVLDGQASWYDKSPAEAHRSHCLHCLELWTSLLEMVAWDRTRQPWAADKIAPLLAVVPAKQEQRKPSLFARMFGK